MRSRKFQPQDAQFSGSYVRVFAVFNIPGPRATKLHDLLRILPGNKGQFPLTSQWSRDAMN